jgi:hypothetical protein
MLLPLIPVDRTGASVDSSPSVGAFPEVGAGRHPRLRFRDLVGIYSLRPAVSLDRPRRSLSRGFDPAVAHRQSLVSFRALSTSARLVSSSQWVYDRFRTHPTLRGSTFSGLLLLEHRVSAPDPISDFPNFHLTLTPNQHYSDSVPPTEGRCATSRTREAGCGGREGRA